MAQQFWKTVWRFPHKIKHIITIRPSNSTLSHLLKMIKNTCLHKHLYTKRGSLRTIVRKANNSSDHQELNKMSSVYKWEMIMIQP